jgi:hypothetical protein
MVNLTLWPQVASCHPQKASNANKFMLKMHLNYDDILIFQN